MSNAFYSTAIMTALSKITGQAAPMTQRCVVAILTANCLNSVQFREPEVLRRGRPTPTVVAIGDQTAKSTAILLISDATRKKSITPDGLVYLYGLTPRQADLAHSLAQEKTLSEAADALEITKETARQYLKAVFVKMGIHRQTELVQNIAAI